MSNLVRLSLRDARIWYLMITGESRSRLFIEYIRSEQPSYSNEERESEIIETRGSV